MYTPTPCIEEPRPAVGRVWIKLLLDTKIFREKIHTQTCSRWGSKKRHLFSCKIIQEYKQILFRWQKEKSETGVSLYSLKSFLSQLFPFNLRKTFHCHEQGTANRLLAIICERTKFIFSTQVHTCLNSFRVQAQDSRLIYFGIPYSRSVKGALLLCLWILSVRSTNKLLLKLKQ